MLEAATIARPYARAAFALAEEEEAFSDWSEMLQILSRIVNDSLMRSLIGHPKVDRKGLVDFLLGIGSELFPRNSELFSGNRENFVRVLVDAGRLSVAPKIAELFEQQCSRLAGVTKIDFVSAYPLTPEQTAGLDAAMANRLGKKVESSSSVDKSLIGGVVIRFGDSVIDASIRGRLQKLQRILIT